MIRTIDGKRYLMRDQRPIRELRKFHAAFCLKYRSAMPFHHWLIERGRVSLCLNR